MLIVEMVGIAAGQQQHLHQQTGRELRSTCPRALGAHTGHLRPVYIENDRVRCHLDGDTILSKYFSALLLLVLRYRRIAHAHLRPGWLGYTKLRY